MRAGRKRSPIKFDDDDAGNDFVVSDGSTALIKDYMGNPDNYQGLESMQITFKSPGSFQRADTLGETQEPHDSESYQTVTHTDTHTITFKSPGRFKDSRDEHFDTSPLQARNSASLAHGPAGVNFSPSVFLRSTPRAAHTRSPMQMVDGFVVPSPLCGPSGKKKRGCPSSAAGIGGSASKLNAESVRKRAASMPAAQDSADSGGAAGPSPMRTSIGSLTPESSFEMGASAGFSDERIGILSPSDGEIELTGRESLGTVVSLRVSAGTTPSPALKSVMQSIARQSGLSAKGSTSKSSAPAARSAADSTQAQISTSPNQKVSGSDSGPTTNLERDKILARASSMPEPERGVLSVNLAASKFSPPPNPEQRAHRDNARQSLSAQPQEQQDEQSDTALSPASFYRSVTGESPYASGAKRAADGVGSVLSPSSSSSSSPASSVGAPSPTYEERQAAAARDRSLVDQLVQPIAQPISQEWTKSPAPTAW